MIYSTASYKLIYATLIIYLAYIYIWEKYINGIIY